VIFLGAVEWIYKSPSAIFSQPIFLTNIWTALFETEPLKEKPPRLTCSKIPRSWRNNPLKWVLSISRDYWFHFEKVPQNSNSEGVRRIERLFSWANLVLRPAWHYKSFVIIRFLLTLGSIKQSNSHPRKTEMKRPMPSTSLARVTVCLEGVWKFLFVEKLSGPHSTTFSSTFPSPPKWNHLELTRWFQSTSWLLC